jgi:sodium-dependent phosphate cotransporter
VRVVLVLLLVYLFLVAIELLGASFKSVGAGTAKSLIESFDNPFAGLVAGILATVLVQSSSVTTSTIVALVGRGALPLSVAVPMIMGANVGTTVTNTLVSLGHVTRDDEFKRAFAGATVHDFFNLLTVAILFPIELATGFLQHAAQALAGMLPIKEGEPFESPIKEAVKWLAEHIQSVCDGVGLQGGWLALVLLVIALVLIVLSLFYITKNMKALMANRIEEMLNRVLARSGLLGLAIGALITVSVQSSSITTSLLIPLFAAGLLNLEAAFPIMLGANIGTTVTAFLAALVTDVNGLTIALVHLLFNVCGTLMFLPFPPMRRIPIWLARRLAELAIKNRVWVLAYVGLVFVVFPSIGVFFFQLLK